MKTKTYKIDKNTYKYQVYCDRGKGLELDGCWGSENAKFNSKSEAEKACRELEKQYKDCTFLVCDIIQ